MTRVVGDIRIDGPREKVWDILADLGSVHIWSPTVASAYYTSEAKGGVGASRRCDFPDGGYVEESATEWKSGESYTLEIREGSVPFENARGTFTVRGDGQGTFVGFAFEYTLKPGVPADPLEVERQNREELIPTIPAALKHYVETGEPMPVPASYD